MVMEKNPVSTYSLASLVEKVVLNPNEITWPDLDGIEMHGKDYIKPTYETMEYMCKYSLTKEEIEYYVKHASVPSCLSTLVIWTQNFVFVTTESGPDHVEFVFQRIVRNPVFDR